MIETTLDERFFDAGERVIDLDGLRVYSLVRIACEGSRNLELSFDSGERDGENFAQGVELDLDGPGTLESAIS